MIVVINNVVAGVGIALLVYFLDDGAVPPRLASVLGVAGTILLTWAFYAYPRWRFDEYDFRAGRWRRKE